jgi:serine/threonine-protein kinase HipA
VGSLREDDRHSLQFTYDAEWLDREGFPISIRLPLSIGDRETEAHGFFEGLLPEGRVRDRVCRQLKVDLRDDLGLLLAIGEDCAGALSILPTKAGPIDATESSKHLSATEFDRLVRSLGAEAAAIVGSPQRFSLAGAQEKLPLIFDGADYAVPNRANPSTHILKFETIPRVCFAEYVANETARRVGLPTVNTEYLRNEAGGPATPYLRIERYDRERASQGPSKRIHQEDIIQALGFSTLLKYQRDGGPSLGDVATLLREHTARPVEMLARLRDWQIFNCLIGNWDGHGKNLALLYRPGEAVPNLAPFYDLVAIEFLNLLRPHTYDREMAFAIGGQHVPERIGRSDWETFARELRMPVKTVLARTDELASSLQQAAADVRERFATSCGDDPAYDRFVESVRRRCKWTAESIAKK